MDSMDRPDKRFKMSEKSYEDSRARDPETGQFVTDDAGLDHPGIVVNDDKFMKYSPWMKEWIRLGMEMEEGPYGTKTDVYAVAATIHAQVLKAE